MQPSANELPQPPSSPILRLWRRLHYRAFFFGIAPLYVIVSTDTDSHGCSPAIFRKLDDTRLSVPAFRTRQRAVVFLRDTLHSPPTHRVSRINRSEWRRFVESLGES